MSKRTAALLKPGTMRYGNKVGEVLTEKCITVIEYAVLHLEKVKGADGAMSMYIERTVHS